MPTKPHNLTGSRARDRRLALGLKQAAVARDAGISASYLNLIEHNRRPIGGKVLVRLAAALRIESQALSEGADAALLDALRRCGGDLAETNRVEELVGRFPGWAGTVADQARRIEALEQQLQRQNDRLTHDPVLSDRMHDMLAAVAAIRSTASILVATPQIDAHHRARFHANIDTESRRLADSSGAMARHFDALTGGLTGDAAPRQAVSTFFDAHGGHFAALEERGAAAIDDMLQGAGDAATRPLIASLLTRYAQDALALPMEPFVAAARGCGFDPAVLAAGFGAPMARVLRRLASLPSAPDLPQIGFVSCDAAGAILLRKPCAGFAMPRFGAACAQWPLFAALRQPETPIRQEVVTPDGRAFVAYAVAGHVGPASFDAPSVIQSSMALVAMDVTLEGAAQVGPTCRLCQVAGCAARREPSSLSDEVLTAPAI